MKQIKIIKRIYYLHIMCLIFIILMLYIGPKNRFFYSVPVDNLSASYRSSVVNQSISSLSSIVNLVTSSLSSVVDLPSSSSSSIVNLAISSPSSVVDLTSSPSSSSVNLATSTPSSVVNLPSSSSSSIVNLATSTPSSVVNLPSSPSSSNVNLATSTSSLVVNLPSSSSSSVVNQSTFSQSSFVNLSNSYSINSLFRNELINQRLTSYSLIYENSSRECDISTPLTAKQNESFLVISKSLDSLRQQIVPYPDEYFHGRGIVLTVGLRQMRLVKTNLKMIELTNTRLPVQIWYSSTQLSHQVMINLLDEAPKLNSSVCCFDTNQCQSRTKNWQLNATHVYKPSLDKISKAFPYKPAAIISATFAEVLFLDCDAYLTRDPEDLFLSDPMYHKFGALFYPDAYKSRQHPSIWKVLNTSCAAEEYELDSATILVDKKRVWNGLYLTKLMNDNHKIFYRHVTDGDKDTFRLGFRYMNVKYYLVMIPCTTGSFDGKNFCGKTLCKTDSLGQHIYINHVHIFKYEGVRYTRPNLDYTRVGLVDPNNNSLSFLHCGVPQTKKTCFYIMKNSNLPIVGDPCSANEIPSEEIEDHQYMLDQPLLFEKSRDNQVLISKTNNLMPNFVDNFLKYIS